MCSNDEFQHQSFWDKVNTKLNEEQTWLSEQERLFHQQSERDLALLFCQTHNARKIKLTEDK